MADGAKVSAEAVSALLTGLAEAMTDAQLAMSELPPADAFGRPLPGYRLPKLDFTFEIETVERDGRIDLRPAGQSASRTISSTVSGQIVAVPPNGGLPEPQIDVALDADDRLTVQLSDAAGALLDGTALELEYDPEASRTLYGTVLDGAARLKLLGAQRVRTDGAGLVQVPIDRSALADGQKAVILLRTAGGERRLTLGAKE